MGATPAGEKGGTRMEGQEYLTPQERDELKARGVDVDLSRSILEGFNQGRLGRTPLVAARGVPTIDGEGVLDLRGGGNFLPVSRGA